MCFEGGDDGHYQSACSKLGAKGQHGAEPPGPDQTTSLELMRGIMVSVAEM